MPYGPEPHGTVFWGFALEYSGWKLNGVPLQSTGLVFMNPFAADAIMNPLRPVVVSVSRTSNACPPAIFASNMWITIRSPWFIMSVLPLGVYVRRLESCGLGGPSGIPSVWMNAKFTGSMQLSLHVPAALHATLSMVSAEHQWELSQLIESENGAKPGG